MKTCIEQVVERLSPKVTDGDKLNTLKITDGVSKCFIDNTHDEKDKYNLTPEK